MDLPTYIIQEIVLCFPVKDRARLTRTCKSWRNIIVHLMLGKNQYLYAIRYQRLDYIFTQPLTPDLLVAIALHGSYDDTIFIQQHLNVKKDLDWIIPTEQGSQSALAFSFVRRCAFEKWVAELMRYCAQEGRCDLLIQLGRLRYVPQDMIVHAREYKDASVITYLEGLRGRCENIGAATPSWMLCYYHALGDEERQNNTSSTK